jgi:hypothetical protein
VPLRTLGCIRELYAGVLVLVIEFAPDRAISVTRLPGGLMKLELGDEMVTLNPSEARHQHAPARSRARGRAD